jgi:putative Holliday junction resolvase
MRIMALDVGDRRIGVATSDPSETLASPLTTIARRGETKDVEEVLRLAAQHEVGEIIVGLPISLSGHIGPQAQQSTRFAKTLGERASVPVKTVDERFSTFEAKRLLRESGVEPSRNKARVDAVAAAVILQSYLDSRRARSDSPR